MAERARQITVAEVMTTDVEFVAADATTVDVATLMGEIEVGGLPVGTAARLDGIVTDRDILYRVVAQGLDPRSVTAREIASSPVVTCRETDSIQQAMDAMAAQQVRRLPVADEGGRVIGWLTLADISRRLLLDSDALQRSLGEMTDADPQAA